MAGLRETIAQKPWVGWAIAGVLFAAAVYFYMTRSSGANVQYGQEYMTKMVTVKFADTGDEMELPRGRFEKMIRESSQGALDATKGIINPKTNQPTGFLFSKSDWDETIARINKERAELGVTGSEGAPAADKSTVAPAPPDAPK